MSQSLPILYSFRRCPYAMRARFTLAYSGIECQLREVDLKHKPKALLDISAKATVPALQLPDTTVINESLDIMRYALSKNDPQGWLHYDKSAMDAIIYVCDEEFAPVLRTYKYHERYPDIPKSEALHKAEEIFIAGIEERLRQDDYVMGEHMSFADMGIFPLVRQFAMADQQWFDQSEYRGIAKWLKTISGIALYERVMKKYSPWKPGDTVVVFR